MNHPVDRRDVAAPNPCNRCFLKFEMSERHVSWSQINVSHKSHTDKSLNVMDIIKCRKVALGRNDKNSIGVVGSLRWSRSNRKF